jgi:hypothetical protein
MMVYPYLVAVDRQRWDECKAGNEVARAQIKAGLKGVVLYTHFLSTEPNEIPVTVQELCDAGCIGELQVLS